MNTDISEKLPYKDCGVNEDMFPCMGTCYRKNDALFVTSYEKICPLCDISPSIVYGASLKIMTIFECSRFDYSKRVIK